MEGDYTPFDLQRMFLGEDFAVLLLLEIVVRTAIMYTAALTLVRFIGKRGLGQLSPFEYIVVIAMGSAAGDPMFYPDVPLLHGIIVLAGVVLLEKGLISVAGRSERVSHFVESVPDVLIRDGVILDDHLRREGISRDELKVKLRERGITNVGQVQTAYLEPSGALSIFQGPEGGRFRGESTLPNT